MVLEKRQVIEMYRPKLSCENTIDFTYVYNDDSALADIIVQVHASGCFLSNLRAVVNDAVVCHIVELKMRVAKDFASKKVAINPLLSFDDEFIKARAYVDGPMRKVFKNRQKELTQKVLSELKYNPMKQFIIYNIACDLVRLFRFIFVKITNITVSLFYRRIIFACLFWVSMLSFFVFIECMDMMVAVKLAVSIPIVAAFSWAAWRRWCV